MKSMHVLSAIVAGLTLVLSTIVLAQTTNAIPEGVFLTDDGHVFWFKPGKRLADVKKIKEAENLSECRAAEQDPDGHWGVATNGLQLSLRFEKSTFTNNEPVIAILLLRNVTNVPVQFLRTSISYQPSPINVLTFKDGIVVPTKNGNDKIEGSATEINIYPQSQLKYKVKLNDFYDLSKDGEFTFRAEYIGQFKVTSQDVSVQIK